MSRRIRRLLLIQAISSLLALAYGGWRYREAMAEPGRKLAVCRQNLQRIHRAIDAYRNDHGGEYPHNLVQYNGRAGWEATGLYPRYLNDPLVLICPAVTYSSFDPPSAPGYYTTYGYDLLYTGDPPTTPERHPIVSLRSVRSHTDVKHLPLRRHEEFVPTLDKDMTVVWCAAHRERGDTHALPRVALKSDGRIVSEPGFGRTEERIPRRYGRLWPKLNASGPPQ